MKYREQGKSGLGGMDLSHASGKPVDKKEMTKLLPHALDPGYNTLFDTAKVSRTFKCPHDNSVPQEEVEETMQELIREGKISPWNISEETEEIIRHAHSVCPFVIVQNLYFS